MQLFSSTDNQHDLAQEKALKLKPLNIEPLNLEPLNLEPLNLEPLNIEPLKLKDGLTLALFEEVPEFNSHKNAYATLYETMTKSLIDIEQQAESNDLFNLTNESIANPKLLKEKINTLCKEHSTHLNNISFEKAKDKLHSLKSKSKEELQQELTELITQKNDLYADIKVSTVDKDINTHPYFHVKPFTIDIKNVVFNFNKLNISENLLKEAIYSTAAFEEAKLLIKEKSNYTFQKALLKINKNFTFASQSPTKKSKSSIEDAVGNLVAVHLIAPGREEKAATIIATSWRNYYRRHTIHRSPLLFGKNSADTKNNHIFVEAIPKKLHHVFYYQLPLLFDSTTHHTYYLADIFHDGRIFSKTQSNIQGISTIVDNNRFDSKLVFTAPYTQYDRDKIVLSLNELLDHHSSDVFYFKLSDWAFNVEFKTELAPGIELEIKFNLPTSTVVLKNTAENKLIATFDMPSEFAIYHGIYGLNKYLTFFIFKLLANFRQDLLEIQAIYTHFEKLDKENTLIKFLQEKMIGMLKYAELDSINSLKLTFSMLLKITLDKTNYDLDLLRTYIKDDDINAVSSFFSNELSKVTQNSYFFAKGLLDFATEYNAQKVIFYVKNTYQSILDTYYDALLVKEAEWVYQNILSKPFINTNSSDAVVILEDQAIYRPNHGLAHSFSSAYFIPMVIQYFSNHAQNQGFKDFCKNIDKDTELMLKRAMLFSVSGRECEVAFVDDPETYNSYRKKSAEQFFDFAKRFKLKKEDVDTFVELIQFMGNLSYLKECNSPQKEYLFHIMNLAHKLDLMRCYTAFNYDKALSYQCGLVEPSIKQQKDWYQLLEKVTALIEARGDRMFCVFKQGLLVDCNRDYNLDFIDASTNPKKLFALLERTTKSFALLKQTNEKIFTRQNSTFFASYKANDDDKIEKAEHLLVM